MNYILFVSKGYLSCIYIHRNALSGVQLIQTISRCFNLAEKLSFFHNDNTEITRVGEGNSMVLDHIKEKSLGNNYYEIPEDEKIVALTTCRSPASTRRMVVILTIDEEIQTADENDEQNLKNYIEKH